MVVCCWAGDFFFKINACLSQILLISALKFNVMAIRNQRHASVGKQTTLFVDVDFAPPNGAA